MRKRIEANISGIVQGVFFRSTTRKRAQTLGIEGWVANLHDGTVKVVAEGPEEKLQDLVQFLHEGSPQARVDNVEITWMEATGEFGGFSVRMA